MSLRMTQKKLLSPKNVIERLPNDKLPWVPKTFHAQFPIPVRSSFGLRPKTRWHAAVPEASPSHSFAAREKRKKHW